VPLLAPVPTAWRREVSSAQQAAARRERVAVVAARQVRAVAVAEA
jgi:hypothetical protein